MAFVAKMTVDGTVTRTERAVFIFLELWFKIENRSDSWSNAKYALI